MCFSNTGNLPWPNLPASESVDDFTVISMTRKFKDLYFYLLCIMEQCFQTRLREEEVTLGPVSLSQEKIWIISEEITRVIPDVTHLRLSTSQNDQPGSGPLCFAHSLADTENLKSILQKGLLLVWSLYLRARGGGGGFWWTTEVKIPRDWEALWRLHLLPLGQSFHLGWPRRKHVQMPVLVVNVVQWEKTWGGKHLRKARDFQQRLPLWAVTQWVEGKVTASLGMGVGGEGESVRWGWEVCALGVGWESVEWPRTIRLWICLTSPGCWVLEIMEDYHNK